MTNYTKILATGSYLPAQRISNHDLEKKLDTSDEWIQERTGICARHIAAEDETAASMAKIAAERALATANLKAEHIDLIIVATCTPDRMFPSTACFVQKELGCRTIPAFDLSAACAGFCYALSVADQFIRTGSYKHILIIGSETMTRTVDWNDRRTCILFGDGAGAMILTASDQPGIHSVEMSADGHLSEILFYPNDEAAPSLKGDSPFMHMQGKEVYRVAVTELTALSQRLLQQHSWSIDHIDWFVAHQANARILEAIAKRLNLPLEKVIMTVSEHANTSSASIPLAFDQAVRAGKIKRGQKLLLAGIGGGMTWGGALITF